MGDAVSNWPKLLSLAVHEFRTPVTVVAGYIRMLLRDRAGPLAETQRKLLEEAEKSCGRLSALLGEMSELGQLHDGRQSLSPGTLELVSAVRDICAEATAGADQPRVVSDLPDATMSVSGDASRLRRSIEAVVFALRREIIDDSDLVIAGGPRVKNGGRVAWLALGARPAVGALVQASADSLGPFNEWRGGSGLALPLARRVIELHGGRLMAPPGDHQKSGAVVELPLTA